MLGDFELAIWLKLLVLAGVTAGSVLLVKALLGLPSKCKNRMGFAPWVAVIVAVGVALSVGKNHQRAPATATIDAENQAAAKLAADPTLDALWDKLTKSKINLDGETDSDPIADSEDEAVKHAVGKTFGLDEHGKLPPQWVITPPKAVGQVYRQSVASDPFVSEEECRRQLSTEQLPQTVARRIEQLASAQVGHSVTVANPLSLGIGLDYIFREICRDEFTTTVDSSVGEMKKTHVLLEFNPSVDRYLADAWLRSERHARLAHFGKIAGLSVTGLAVAYGLLRFDTWSRGYYSKQLLVGSLLAIIAVAVVYLQI